MNPGTFDPGPLADVELSAHGDRWTLVFVRHLRHSPKAVWSALTDPAQLAEWSPFTADRDLGTTGRATLTMIDGDQPQDLTAAVRRAEAPTLLEYTWGDDVLRWELAATESGTCLTLQHTIEDRHFVAGAAAGWHLCLVVAEHLLDGERISPIRGEDAMHYGWAKLHDAYAEKLDIPVGVGGD